MFYNRRDYITEPRTAPAATYIGPADIQTFFGWYGLRGSTAAYAGPAIDIFDPDSANAATISIVNHALDLPTLNAWILAHGPASVSKIYDQIGTNHLLAGGFAQAPVIQIGPTGLKSGYPAMTLLGIQALLLAAGGYAITQPFSMSVFGLATPGAAGSGILGDPYSFTGVYLGQGNSSLYAGNSIFGPSVTDSVWYAAHYLGAGAASYIYLDSTPSAAQDAGTAGMSSLCMGKVYNNFEGKAVECGVVQGDARSNFLTLAANQRAYWLP